MASGGTSGFAHALQPLDEFLKNARHANPSNMAAKSTAEQRKAEANAARGAILPSLTLEATYTLNQFEAISEFPNDAGGTDRLVFTPKHQFDGYGTLSVPIVDAAGVLNYRAGKALSRAARESRKFTFLDVQRQVVRVYYELLGFEAVKQSAEQNLAAAQENADVVGARKAQGASSDLDYQRAVVNLESARQSVATAELNVALKRQELANLTGLQPAAVKEFPVDDLHAEKPLAHWTSKSSKELPLSRVAYAQVEAAEQSGKAAKAVWAPTVTATGQERLTNATGFVDSNNVYAVGASLLWRLDGTTAAAAKAQRAAADVALADARQAELDSRFAVYEAWHRIRTGIDKSRAARKQAEAAGRASQLASQQYVSGVATQLDVVQAQRDAFDARVERIRADVDLVYSRALLRLAVGQSLDKTAAQR